jgi:hypothetical protein
MAKKGKNRDRMTKMEKDTRRKKEMERETGRKRECRAGKKRHEKELRDNETEARLRDREQ